MRAHAAPTPGVSPGPTTRTRPKTVLVISAIFLALGCLDLYRAIAPLAGGGPWARAAADSAIVGAVGIAALVGAAFLLSGRNWARWLLAAWMALHVLISIGDPAKLLAHVVIFGMIAFLLFRPGMRAYFRRPLGEAPGG